MNKKSLLLLVPFAVAALTGCTPNKQEKPCSDVGVTFTDSEMTIGIGGTPTKIPFTTDYTGECTGDYNFVSNNPEVATVDGKGNVLGVKEGDAVITVNGGAQTFTVHVKAGVDPSIEEITPARAIELMDAAGEGVVVEPEYIVVGVMAEKSYDSKNDEYYGKFEGSSVKISGAKYSGSETIDNGCTIKVKGYLEKYNGEYKIGYLPANVSPTGEKYTATIVSVSRPAGKDVKSVDGVKSAPTQVAVGEKVAASRVILNVTLEDDSPDTVPATKIELDTSKAAESVVGKAWYNNLGPVTFTTKVVAEAESSIKEAYLAAEALKNDGKTQTEQYTFSGVVVGKRDNKNEKGEVEVFVQDGGYAVDVFNPTNKAEIAVGNKVTVKAKLKNYNGTIETGDIESVKVDGNGSLPTETVIDSKATLEATKVSVLASMEGSIKSIPQYDKSADMKVVVAVASGDDVTLFFKKNFVESFKSVYQSLAVGDHISVNNAVVGDFKGRQVLVVNDTQIVKGQQKQVSTLTVKTQPSKTSYLEGEKFDDTGLVLHVVYSDGEEKDINSGWTISPSGSLLPSDNKVVVSFGGKTVDVGISVEARVLQGIEVKTQPTNTKYYVGEKFDPAGMVVVANYTSGDPVTITDYTFSPNGELALENNKVTISYQGKTADVNITVEARPAPAAVNVEYSFTNLVRDDTNILTGETAKAVFTGAVSLGEDIVSSVTPTKCYNGDKALRVGTSTGAGKLVLSLSNNVKQVVITAHAYVTNKGPELNTITIGSQTETVEKESKEFIYQVSSTNSITIETSKRVLFDKIGFVAEGMKEIESIEIDGTPSKTEYFEGQSFDPSGLRVKLNYTEGDPEFITEGFTFDAANPLAAGEFDIHASYKGKTSTNSVHINVAAKQLVSIAITHGMDKAKYVVGDEWDPTGIVVEGTYNSGEKKTLNATEYTLSFNPTAPELETEEVEITATNGVVTSAAFTQTGITVTPEAEPELESIDVKENPTKMTYNEGESFDPAGLVITANYTLSKPSDDKTYGVDSGIVCEVADPLTATSTTVTIKYTEDGKTVSTTLNISVTPIAEHGTTENDPLNADEAYAISDKLEHQAVTESEYYIEGTVAKINAAYSSDFGNISLDLKTTDGNTFVLYRVSCSQSDADKIVVGTVVKVKAKISRYNSTRETNAAGVFVSINNALTAIKITGSEKIQAGNKSTYTASAVPELASLGTVTWSIESGESYISLPETKTGSSIEVTGVAEGTAVLKATCGDISNIFNIEVTDQAVVDSYEVTFAKDTKTSSYTGESAQTLSNIGWILNGNASLGDYVKLSSGTANTTADRYICTQTAFANEATVFSLLTGAKDDAATVNSITLTIHDSAADAKSGSNSKGSVTADWVANGTITFNKPAGISWAGKFFRVTFNLSNTTKNKGIIVTGAKVVF